MANINISDRERYALYVVINPMNHPERNQRRMFDRLWDKLRLNEIAERAVLLAPNAPAYLTFDDSTTTSFDLSSEQGDLIIDKVCACTGLNTMFGRMLNRLEDELIKLRQTTV